MLLVLEFTHEIHSECKFLSVSGLIAYHATKLFFACLAFFMKSPSKIWHLLLPICPIKLFLMIVFWMPSATKFHLHWNTTSHSARFIVIFHKKVFFSRLKVKSLFRSSNSSRAQSMKSCSSRRTPYLLKIGILVKYSYTKFWMLVDQQLFQSVSGSSSKDTNLFATLLLTIKSVKRKANSKLLILSQL